MSDCQFLGCTLRSSAVAADTEGRRWDLCRGHSETVVRAVAGHFIVDTLEPAGKGLRVQVRAPARYSGADWDAHYRLLERPGHVIHANGAAFAVAAASAPVDVLICGCGWRGHYRMWPRHLRDVEAPLALTSTGTGAW